MIIFQEFFDNPMGEEHTGQKVIGGYSLCLFWPVFFLGASFCNFENWMDDILSFLRFFAN